MLEPRRKISLGRHRRNCSICGHAQRDEIEREFIGWCSPAELAKQFGLPDRTALYRHAHATGVFEKRQRNLRAALERIIEKAGEVEVTASSIVAAVQAYARINAAGQWIESHEQIKPRELFERMTHQELETYAQTGALPEWFPRDVG